MIYIQNAFGVVFFKVLFITATLMVSLSSSGSLISYIIIPPAFFFVFSFAGFTSFKRDKHKFHKLGPVLSKDMIFGGWIGLLTWISLSLYHYDGLDKLLPGVGASPRAVLYGYVYGHLKEACLPQKYKKKDLLYG
jgi:hypothetical protein